MKKYLLALFLSFYLFNCLFAQDTLRVPDEFDTIQEALDSASDDDVVFLDGDVYYENLVWPININNLTLLGKIDTSQVIIDGSKNSRVLSINNDAIDPIKASLKNMTLQNGSLVNQAGAGIYAKNIDLNINNVVIKNNTISGDFAQGGGMMLVNCGGIIENSKIETNKITSNDVCAGAGIAFIYQSEDIVLNNCLISGNEAKATSVAQGGGIYIQLHTDLSTPCFVEISNSFIAENLVDATIPTGGGLCVYGDHGIFGNDLIICNITSSEFEANSGQGDNNVYGSAIYLLGGMLNVSNSNFNKNGGVDGAVLNLENSSIANFENCRIRENFSLGDSRSTFMIDAGSYSKFNCTNCIFALNEGHVLKSNTLGTDGIDFIHCTFIDNDFGIESISGGIRITNSVLWNKNEEFDINLNTTVSIKHSIVKGGFNDPTVISDDPKIDAFTIRPDKLSPCINSGIDLGILTDIDGHPRPLPIGSLPDIGAYEIDQTLSSTEIENELLEISLFPNPAFSMINLSKEVEMIIVYNSLGEKVLTFHHISNIDIEFWTEGTYILRILDHGNQGIRKIIKI